MATLAEMKALQQQKLNRFVWYFLILERIIIIYFLEYDFQNIFSLGLPPLGNEKKKLVVNMKVLSQAIFQHIPKHLHRIKILASFICSRTTAYNKTIQHQRQQLVFIYFWPWNLIMLPFTVFFFCCIFFPLSLIARIKIQLSLEYSFQLAQALASYRPSVTNAYTCSYITYIHTYVYIHFWASNCFATYCLQAIEP